MADYTSWMNTYKEKLIEEKKEAFKDLEYLDKRKESLSNKINAITFILNKLDELAEESKV